MTEIVLYLVSVSTTSSSSSTSIDNDEPIYEVVKSSKARLPSVAQTVPHANTLPMTNKQMKKKRRNSSSSSSSSSSSDSSKPSRIKKAQTLTETSLTPFVLQNLNRNYQPVYKLRKANSMTQTDYKEPTETAA